MNNKASSALAIVGAFGAGMLAMYLTDPARGAWRRTMLGAAAGHMARRVRPRRRHLLQDEIAMSSDYIPDELAVRGRAAGGMVARAPHAALDYVSHHKGLVAGIVAGLALLPVLLRSKGDAQGKSLEQSGVHIDKDLFIAAPPERVFQFWRKQDNLAQCMRHVKEISRAGEGRWHWKVSGPLGSTVEWDAIVTQDIENRTLAWESAPGAEVATRGRVDFEPQGSGTRLHVSMDYAPPAGKLGDAVARLFGKDAKSEMDEDLMRLKSKLESGSLGASAGAGTSDLNRPTATGGDAARPMH